MMHFCKIHNTNYQSQNGCPLWSETDEEYKANKNCFPSESHPKYKQIMKLRKINTKIIRSK